MGISSGNQQPSPYQQQALASMALGPSNYAGGGGVSQGLAVIAPIVAALMARRGMQQPTQPPHPQLGPGQMSPIPNAQAPMTQPLTA